MNFTPDILAPRLVKPAIAECNGRADIEAFHEAVAAGEQAEIETRHYFANGLYAREIVLPAGTWAVGSIHTEDHINVLSKGDVSVATEIGARRFQAPATFEAKAGRKVIGFAHSDAVWTTFHANPGNERDTEKLFALFTTAEYPDLIEGGATWLS